MSSLELAISRPSFGFGLGGATGAGDAVAIGPIGLGRDAQAVIAKPIDAKMANLTSADECPTIGSPASDDIRV